MIRRLYDWMMGLAGGRLAPHALFWVSFAESSFFPIPPDVMLIPMVIKERAKAWLYAGLATIASVIGGVAGYAIGYYLLESIGKPVINFYGLAQKFDQAAAWFNENGVLILILKGMTPIPYKLLTITAGAVHMNLAAFIRPAVLVRRADPPVHREAPDPGHDRGRGAGRRWIRGGQTVRVKVLPPHVLPSEYPRPWSCRSPQAPTSNPPTAGAPPL
jgi:membrane protein YqaA with SNARE-associated domain